MLPSISQAIIQSFSAPPVWWWRSDDSGNPLVRVGQANVAIGASKLPSGDIVFDRIDINKATLQLRTDAQGKNNWQDLLSADDKSAASSQNAPASLPAIAALDLNDITIGYQYAQSDLSANFLVNASGSTLADDIDTNVRAVGELNGQAVKLKLQALASGEEAVRVDAQLALGRYAIDRGRQDR